MIIELIFTISKWLSFTWETHSKKNQVINLFDESIKIIIKWLGIPEPVLTILYSLFDPIYAFHKEFLTILEARVAEWSHEQG